MQHSTQFFIITKFLKTHVEKGNDQCSSHSDEYRISTLLVNEDKLDSVLDKLEQEIFSPFSSYGYGMLNTT